MTELRAIALDSGLTEELKWYQPCYTFNGNNVAIISAFKEYCVLSFFKGALLKDPNGILVRPTENMQAARQIRFTSKEEIEKLAPVARAYLLEAAEVERAGLKVNFKKIEEFPIPAEFQRRLDEDPGLKAAFQSLTPGRQRAYLLHFSAAKQAITREARIDKCVPQIMEGKGLND